MLMDSLKILKHNETFDNLMLLGDEKYQQKVFEFLQFFLRRHTEILG